MRPTTVVKSRERGTRRTTATPSRRFNLNSPTLSVGIANLGKRNIPKNTILECDKQETKADYDVKRTQF